MASFSRGTLLLLSPSTLSSPLLPRSTICLQCLRRAPQSFRLQSSQRQFSILRALRQQHASAKRSLDLTPRRKSNKLQAPTERTTTPPKAYPNILNSTLTTPTVVYQAPPQRTYIFASFMLGAFFTLYGAYIAIPDAVASSKRKDAQGVPVVAWIIPPMMIGAGVVFLGIGYWCASAGFRLVKRIVVVPSSLRKAGGGSGLGAKVEVTHFLPTRVHTIEVPVEDLTLGRSIPTLTNTKGPSKMARPEDVPYILRPLVYLTRFAGDWFTETKNSFMRLNMVSLHVPGHGKFKLDTRGDAYGGADGLSKLFRVDYTQSTLYDRHED